MASKPARRAEPPRVEFDFEQAFRVRRGIAYPRFPIRVQGQILKKGEAVLLVDDGSIGEGLLDHWNQTVTLRRRDGIWTLRCEDRKG